MLIIFWVELLCSRFFVVCEMKKMTDIFFSPITLFNSALRVRESLGKKGQKKYLKIAHGPPKG